MLEYMICSISKTFKKNLHTSYVKIILLTLFLISNISLNQASEGSGIEDICGELFPSFSNASPSKLPVREFESLVSSLKSAQFTHEELMDFNLKQEEEIKKRKNISDQYTLLVNHISNLDLFNTHEKDILKKILRVNSLFCLTDISVRRQLASENSLLTPPEYYEVVKSFEDKYSQLEGALANCMVYSPEK